MLMDASGDAVICALNFGFARFLAPPGSCRIGMGACVRWFTLAQPDLPVTRIRAESLLLGGRGSSECVAALDAIVEPLVEHDVSQPSISELARELRSDCFEHRVAMPACARLHLGQPSIVIDTNL